MQISSDPQLKVVVHRRQKPLRSAFVNSDARWRKRRVLEILSGSKSSRDADRNEERKIRSNTCREGVDFCPVAFMFGSKGRTDREAKFQDVCIGKPQSKPLGEGSVEKNNGFFLVPFSKARKTGGICNAPVVAAADSPTRRKETVAWVAGRSLLTAHRVLRSLGRHLPRSPLTYPFHFSSPRTIQRYMDALST
ncbi:hypothetical protein VTN00DRAFT_4536 [Thermoascus crustaceus]|uniref:uncharacterized protein n=1 Tax=Thermoascus crustaceus TaxID=5088 RepID=UPI003743E3AC